MTVFSTKIKSFLSLVYFSDFKLLVAAGISNEGYTDTSEIIDLEKPSGALIDFQQLPTMLDTPLAGYLDGSIPLVCGKSILSSL
jgi:hypothetical protein